MSNRDNFYTSTTVNFGKQRQPIELLVDTGSSWTWTYSDDCSADSTSAICQTTKGDFHHVDSETFTRTDKTKFI